MKEGQAEQNTMVFTLIFRNRFFQSQQTIYYENLHRAFSAPSTLFGWRGLRNQGEQIYTLMGRSHKLNYILVAVQYEGNLK